MRGFSLAACAALLAACAPGDDPRADAAANEPASSTPAQAGGPDPATVDPGHYRVEFENECVRILRVTYGPGETSPMHHHRPYVAVFLTGGGPFRFTLPDGTIEASGDTLVPRTASYAGSESHSVEHLGSSHAEGVFVEIKGDSCPASPR